MSKNRKKALSMRLVSVGKVTDWKIRKKHFLIFKQIIAQNLILMLIPEHQIELEFQIHEFCPK